ncbi:MAG: 2-C-methyl-D-erythritol 2,4-cyclodiphosphate synthase [Phycisphaerae bacterium]|nr:2-C-methyl-D-erythritol 2,4-cyclodiphosphate synthase [Phycisphaerae bacterium]
MQRHLPRVGIGWDVHRLVAGRPLMLAGVQVPCDRGLLGHSDGDVILHAVIDAMLGAAGLNDIGQMFPDTDPAWQGADSRKLLRLALAAVQSAGWTPVQADTVVVVEKPKLAPHKDAMRASLAGLLGLPAGDVNIKAKTAEGFGEIGAGEAIACYAVAMLAPVQRMGTEQLV